MSEKASKQQILRIWEEVMIDKIDVLKRVQSLKNKVDGLEASQERRKQDVQKKRSQIEKEKTLA